MVDVIVVLVVLLILGGAIGYIVHAKKNGAHCIGCPSSGKCAGHCSGACHCEAAEQPVEHTCCDTAAHTPD